MKKVISIALIAMLVVAMAGCAQSQPTATAAPAGTAAKTTAAPQTEVPATTAALSGTVATDGSTSMEKVIGALGEAFMEANSGVNFPITPPAPAPASPPFPKAAATSACPPVR